MMEYRGYTIGERSDFVIDRVSPNLTIFFFDPKWFDIDPDAAREFSEMLTTSTNLAARLDIADLMLGIVRLTTNPTRMYFDLRRLIEEKIIQFFFDRRMDDEE